MHKLHYLLLPFSFLMFAVPMSAQQNNDSLQRVYRTAKHDTVKLSALRRLTEYYTFKYLDSTELCVNRTDSILRKHEHPDYRASYLHARGNIAWWQGNLNLARKFYLQSIQIYKNEKNFGKIAKMQFNLALTYQNQADSALLFLDSASLMSLKVKDSLLYGTVMSHRGEIKLNQADLTISLAYFEEAYSVAQKCKDFKTEIKALHGIGNVMFRLGKYAEALVYFKKEYELAQTYGNIFDLNTSSIDLANTYYKLKDFETSEKYHLLALEQARQSGKPQRITVCLSNIYEQFTAQGRHAEAAPYIQEALQIAEKYDIQVALMSLYINAGKSKLMNKKYAEAKSMILKGLKLARAQNSHFWLIYGYEAAVKADSAVGNFKQALIYKDSVMWFSKKLRENEIDTKIEELNIKYKTVQNEKENLELKNQIFEAQLSVNNRELALWLIGITLVLSFVSLVLFIVNRKKLKRQNKQISEQKEEISLQKDSILKQAEKLELSLKKITELTAYKHEMTQMLVHDLKNPLNILINLPAGMPVNERESLRLMTTGTMLNLVMNILEVQKYQETQLVVKPTEFKLSELWKSVCGQFEFLSHRKNITLRQTIETELWLNADTYLTERILVNILSNALKYTNLNGFVELAAEPTPERFAKITISDTGRGIPEADLKTIFQKYKQIGETVQYGTGLGLLFCKIAVEAHGGSIAIRSETGKGTQIEFSLPLGKVSEKETTAITETAMHHLSPDEIAQLKPYSDQLLNADLSQISLFRKLLTQFEQQEQINRAWVTEVRNAVFTKNIERYTALIDQIVNDSRDEKV